MFGVLSPYWWKTDSWSFILVEIDGSLYRESYSHFDSRRSKVKSYKLFFPTDLNKYSFIPSPIRTKLDRWGHQFWMMFGVWPRKLTPVLSVQVMRIIPLWDWLVEPETSSFKKFLVAFIILFFLAKVLVQWSTIIYMKSELYWRVA